jgi:hypothetical protein
MYKSEKTHVDQVSGKVHPPVVLVNLEILAGTNLLCNIGKPQSINPRLL